jgi:hypothetical protein
MTYNLITSNLHPITYILLRRSGAAGDEDEYCALQGAKAVSALLITSEPARHSCATVKDL